MLSDSWSAPGLGKFGSLEPESRAFDFRLAELWVFNFFEMVRGAEMRVAREIAGAGNYMRGNARTLEDTLSFFSVARAGPFADCAIDLVAIAQTADEDVELRVEKRAGYELPQCLPMLVARRVNYDPSIFT